MKYRIYLFLKFYKIALKLKKIDQETENTLSASRLKRRLTRKEKNKRFHGYKSVQNKRIQFLNDKDWEIVKHHSFRLHDFLLEKEFINKSIFPPSHIYIPKNFTFEQEDFESTTKILGDICSSFLHLKGKEITIDFSKCVKTDIATLFILDVLTSNYWEEIKKMESKLAHLKIKPDITIIRSKSEDVNILLAIFDFTFITEDEAKRKEIKSISNLGILSGSKSQKNYHENKKGKNVTLIIQYINRCINQHHYELVIDTKNNIEGMISEILNNGEDHGVMNTWYVTANYVIRQHSENEIIGELNLVFFNFGLSIFEGFEETKEKNHENYEELKQLYDYICYNNPKHNFTKENLFTLYALQEGNSRLKYEQESRGTGTMKFIKSFLEFGDFEETKRGYLPKLSIISGATHLICDNKYHPFSLDNVGYLSLNEEKDLSLLPSKTHLKSLSKVLPGTLLSVKIFLNEEHFNKKYYES